ncbi:MAG: relaxase domain-containing protein [Rickettsiales bacterium]|jgi:conjugative relaxase-like TrwC/TraI family protein|nr:relaxase domain-containing protein [Rickettsiales bacterium]
MLTIENVRSASAGTSYYMSCSYFSSGDEGKLQYAKWYGETAQSLDLKDDVEIDKFNEILKGVIEDEDGATQLGRKNKEGQIQHDCARDLTFAVPKSVSLQHNLKGGDDRIKDAILTSVKNTLYYIEKNFVYTRITENKEVRLEKTHNMLAGMFYENLNRDFEHHDHVHCVIANMTKRGDGQWRSIEFKKIFEHRVHLGKVFRMELSYAMQKLGYNLETTDKAHHFFEIKEFDHKLADHFSGRTRSIIEKAKTISSDVNSIVKQIANLLTRNANKTISSEDLANLTESRIKDYEVQNQEKSVLHKIQATTEAAIRNSNAPSDSLTKATKQIVGNAIEHLSERNTVFLVQDIVAKILTIGTTNIKAILKEIGRLEQKDILILGVKTANNRNLHDQTLYCTAHSLVREKAIISSLIEGKNHFTAITSKKNADKMLETTSLNTGQREAAKLVLTNKDSISLIQGYAGTGKTYMLSVLKDSIETINEELLAENKSHINHKLVGLAPSGAAVKALEEVLGEKNAHTLQGFLAEYAGYAEGRGTQQGKLKESVKLKNHIFVIDEASMMSSKLMQDYLSVAKSLNLKTVLMGDKHQLLGIEEGNPFFQLQKNGATMITMSEIVRQKNNIGKAISYSAYANDTHKVFEKVGTNVVDCSKLKMLENPNHKGPSKVDNIDTALATAKLFMSFDKSKRDETLILAQANDSKNLVNNIIRHILKEEGELGNNSVDLKTFVNQNPTIAERESVKNYHKADVILFNKKNPYFSIDKNEYFQIKNINLQQNLLSLKSLTNKDKAIHFNPSTSKSFRKNIELYQIEQREIRQNDKIMFTRKIEQKDASFINSTVGQVKEIKGDKISISVNDETFNYNKDSLALCHIDYSYCRTTHKGQGLTTKNSIILTESWWKFLTTQRNLLVQATRQKDEIYLVVDSQKEVIKTILKQNEASRSSLEFAQINDHSIDKNINISKSDFENLGCEIEHRKFEIAQQQSQILNKEGNYNIGSDSTSDKIKNSLTKSENFKNDITALDRVRGMDAKIFKRLEEEYRKPDTKVTVPQKHFFIPEISDLEVKQRLAEFIHENIGNNDFNNLEAAIDRAFSQQGRSSYFGEQQKGVVCWYGEAGYVKHFKFNAGEVYKWGKGKIKFDEYSTKFRKVSAEEHLKNTKERELKLKNDHIKKENEYSEAGKKAQYIFDKIPSQNRDILGTNHLYLKSKGLEGAHRLKEINFSRFDIKDEQTGKKVKNIQMIIPLKNIKGAIESFQYINSHDHKKGFMKGGRKLGNFCIIGANNINNSQKIYFAEGVATSASIHAATKCPVVVCFDAGNLDSVIKQIQSKYPTKTFIIAADNDQQKGKINTGLVKAQMAAQKYGVHVLTPAFSTKDILKYQEISKSTKHPSDFNDMHQIHGLRQVSNKLKVKDEKHQSKDFIKGGL